MLNTAVHGYAGTAVSHLPGSDTLLIRVAKETMDLKRFLRLPFASQYLWSGRHQPDGGALQPLAEIPADLAGSSVLFATTAPHSSKVQLRFRKGEKNDKDLFIEVWNERGFVSSRKVSDKVTKIYNDAVFGSVAWSKDETRVAFVGEKAEPAAYKNYWEDEAPPKKEEDGKEDKKEAEEKKATYLDEKYKYIDDFGETLIGKKRPALFIFNLAENTLGEVAGIETFPTYPIFDETSKGIIFAGVKTPI